MTTNEMKERTKQFALRILKMVDHLPHTIAGVAIAKQVVRSGTSPGANYRAACVAKSQKDFINKLKMVEEELDETIYWIEIIMESQLIAKDKLLPLYDEAKELCKITVSSINTAKNSLTNSNGKL
ncbi:MAG: four helix bundle protein [Bacteroidaceae bacterium]|nr:four helix bundle protein [Bacteroidaceae bacterium]